MARWIQATQPVQLLTGVLRALRDRSSLQTRLPKINVNGGAVASGYTLGARDAIVSATLLDKLERTGQQFGLSTLCSGGGMGIATIFEQVN